MPIRPIELVRRPEARSESVEDLLAAVLRGEVRIPVFQRGLEWQTRHVLELFDSIYRGFPIGALLLRRAPAPAGPLHIGPVAVFGIETKNALWVIDGQQRLTSLVAGLGRPQTLPTTPDDPFALYFDPVEQRFHAPPRSGDVPSRWVPVPQLLDSAKLTEWVFTWSHGREDEPRRFVFEAGRRLREYRVPLYVIESDDEDAVRAIPHLRLLPSSAPLVVLARFFTLHPEPNERCTTLLVRWVWRWFLSRDMDERTLKRGGIADIDDDLEASVQRLLQRVPGDMPSTNFVTPNTFDARAAQSRLALLGMASCKPRRLGFAAMTDMSEIDVAELIRQADLAAFRPLFPLSGGLTSIPANRLLLPGSGAALEELRSFIRAHGVDHAVLQSHLIEPRAAQAILDDDMATALNARDSALMGEVDDHLGKRLAEWGRSDRPSLDYLLAQAAGE